MSVLSHAQSQIDSPLVFLFSGMLLVLPYMHVLNEQASFVDPKTIGTLVSVGLVLVVLVSIHLITKHNQI